MDLVDLARNTSLTGLKDAVLYVSLHTAYPGTSGTSEVTGGSPAYARKAVTWGTVASSSVASSGDIDFDVPGGTTIAFAGLWSAVTAGDFYGSVPLGPAGSPKITMATTADVFTAISHGWSNTQTVAVSKTLGALPVGISDGTIYYVRDATTDTFKLATTSGGTAIDITTAGVGLVRAITTETFGGQGTYTVTSLTLNLS